MILSGWICLLKGARFASLGLGFVIVCYGCDVIAGVGAGYLLVLYYVMGAVLGLVLVV